MDIEVVRRVCLARHLYGLSKEHLNSTNDLYLFSTVNLLQDAVESFLLALSDFVRAQIDQRTTFDRYFVLINEKTSPKEIPFKSQLLRLNRIRVDSKHYGIQPSRQEVERLEVIVGEFFSESSASILGESFATLSTIDLLNDGETKDMLHQAREKLEAGELDECAICCRKALYLEVEYKYDISEFREDAPPRTGFSGFFGPQSSAPLFARNADYIKRNVKSPTDYIVYDQAHLHQELSTLRVDSTSYWNIWRLTPSVYRDSQKKWVVKMDLDKLDLEILANKIQYIYDTTINIIFSIHSVKNTIKTADYQRYNLELARDEVNVYEKADTDSTVLSVTPKGVTHLDCDHYIYGFKGDGPYWYVSQFFDKNFTSGYIHNDSLLPPEIDVAIKFGQIKWFGEELGFGFISGDDKVDYFVHQSDVIPKDELPLKSKQHVQFRVQDSPKGPKAIEVDLVPNKAS